ncbi:MAG TPA: hypothetical protein VNY75_10715 [Rhizomicrobium sp.]|jgi:hypothetical protein|nr:hypothetical protein [Rhizomicrobium sp.]
MKSVAVLLPGALLALIVAQQVSFIHHLGTLSGLAIFAMTFAILAGADRLAMRRGWGGWRRTGVTIGLFLILYAINVASSLTRCDRAHHCHRIFSFQS